MIVISENWGKMGNNEDGKKPVQTGNTPAPVASAGVDIQRNALQNTTGNTITDQINRLRKIATGKLKQRIKGENGKYKVVPVQVPVSAMVAAEREIKDILGHKAVERHEVIQRSLLINLNDMSEEDLKAL